MKVIIFLTSLLLTTFSASANTNLVKVGSGSAYWGIFKIYDAQFHTEPTLDLTMALADNTAAKLELCYDYKLTVDNFIKGANSALPQSLSSELQQAVDTLHAAYQPVKKGDCYHLDYTPQTGTQLILNGQTLTRINTPRFKALYFGIWVGDNPLSSKLKQDLTQHLVSK